MAFFQNIEMYSHASAPANPETDYRKIYFKGGYLYWRTDAAKEYRILDDVTAITARAALTTGLASTDELLVQDGGVLKRMDVSVLQSYMEDNLSFDNYVNWNLLADGSGNQILSGKNVELLGGTNIDIVKSTITNGWRLTFNASGAGTYSFDWNGYTIGDGDTTQILDGNGITKSTYITDPPASIRTVSLKLGQLTTEATQATDFAYMAVIDSSWNWKYMTKANLDSIFGGNTSLSLGYHQLTNPSGDTIFDRFDSTMPNTGDLLMTSFQIYFSSSSYRVVGMERISSTSIEIFYATSSGVLTVTATNGDATQLCDKLVGTNINGIN